MIDLERHGDCAVIQFNRPDALNALNTNGLDALEEVLEHIFKSDARALILTGAGDRAFCAGADINELGPRTADQVRTASRRGQAIGLRIENLPFPSIALLNGYALGGGLELSLACTFRLATPNAMMGFPEIKLGICTGWGGTQRLPRLISLQGALDLLMSGRLIDAAEAENVGLIHSITDGDPMNAAVAFAEQFTNNSLPAMGLVREAVLRANEQNLEQGFRTEADLSALSYQLEDSAEGVAAFLDKRKPNFQDR
jgi:enoyl-CoA hydratase